jgi:hypothetical protein
VLAGALAAVGLAAALPEPAAAGAYTVHACRAASGVAPIADSEVGWHPALRPGTPFTTLADECARGGGIHGALSGLEYAYGAGAMWVFRTPPDTSIQAFDLEWRGSARDGGEVSLSRSDQADPVYERRYAGPFGPETVAVRNVDLSHVVAIVACSFRQPSCPAGGAPLAEFRIGAARMVLADRTAPQVSAASGDLLASPTLRGTMGVSVSAEDRGGGLYRVVAVAEDGAAVAAPLSDPGGRCVDPAPANGNPYEFTWPRPCQLQGQATASLDTRGLPEGPHRVTVFVEDAGGNRTPVHGPVDKTIDNERGAANGANGGDGAQLVLRGRKRRTTSFSRRRIVLRGRLTRGGAPVGRAVLDVLARNHRAGSRVRRIAQVRTSTRGNWRVRVPGGPSRTLSVAYRAFVDDQAPAAQVDVNQRVRGSVTLGAARRRVGLFGTARFRGRVRGGYIPQRGKLVELQAFDAGSWRTFKTVRTNRRGRFRSSYRFRRTGVPRTFRFRARARFERGWPYILGVSRAVRVRVG